MQILYHDRDLAVVIKPVGLDSESAVPAAIREALGGEVFTVHRLDLNVGGVMVYARTKQAAATLSRLIQEGTLVKEYVARVGGMPEESGDWTDLLLKDARKNKVFVVTRERGGVKKARLEYTRLETDGETSLVRIRLHTGRSHQIRVQFASRKHPLLGDHKYGAKDALTAPQLFSCCLTFPWKGQTLRFEQLPDWAMLPADRLERIAEMEAAFDRASIRPTEDDLRVLTAYMDSGDWLKDYTADEQGRIPPTMKRGVLSQDGLYNLVCDWEARKRLSLNCGHPSLLEFSGIEMTGCTGDIAADAETLLMSRRKVATWRHVQNVADACVELATRFGLDEAQCRIAGILHDISAVVPAAEMLRYAQHTGMSLDAAEINHPFLLHQRLSAVIAQEAFGVNDDAVLQAIACHTTLHAEASPLDMALFLADKIAWDQPGEPPFLAPVQAALQTSLDSACWVYLDYVMNHGMILQPHQNLLAARDWLRTNVQPRPVIHLFGASGSGTTTLGRTLAERLGYVHMDTDDYYWLPTDPAFTQKRPIPERLAMMNADIDASEKGAVISGSLTGWGDVLISRFTLAVRVVTDTTVRLERLRQREYAHFGDRIHEGGDMYQNHLDFLEWASQYDAGDVAMRSKACHDAWQQTLPCPVLTINGTLPLDENIAKIIAALPL
ncbi:MAG: bis(5'-nucleosyl)-tetraphosphatase (symmetrical) YqeK [Clostridia bacterium]|nr:bis(5'-nucleosyl)-tetraphosphatase (symmetrical) YqeK [Clostridia bacterium]